MINLFVDDVSINVSDIDTILTYLYLYKKGMINKMELSIDDKTLNICKLIKVIK